MSSSSRNNGSKPLPELQLPPSIQENPTLATAMRTMHRIAPLSLADTSWDNVGLLLQAPVPRSGNGVFLCIDLTTDVFNEAIQDPNISVILCYHPIIFRGLKSLTMQDPQQATVLRCAAMGISIYSPHTSLDATTQGLNDWLVRSYLGDERGQEYQQRLSQDTVVPLKPAKEPLPHAIYQGAGMGRRVTLSQPMPLQQLIRNVKTTLGIDHLQLATNQNQLTVTSMAVCAGSGGSVLAGDTSDVWLTGEMSHVSSIQEEE